MTAYWFFLIGSKLVPLLPEWLGLALSKLVGLIFYAVVPGKRRTVMCNLNHVIPDRPLKERRLVARGIFKSVVLNYYDLLRVNKIPQARLNQMVEVYGIPESKILDAQNDNRGVILFSPHVGSFSLAPQVTTYNKIDFHLLVEPIKPPKLFELVSKLREVDPHTHMIPVGGVELRQVFRVLKQPDNYICIAVDRDVTGTGVPMTFFGAEAILPTGTAEIALRTGALLVPLHVYRKNGHYVIRFHHERSFKADSTGDRAADVKSTANRMLREVETILRTTPEQWVVLQPVWPDCR